MLKNEPEPVELQISGEKLFYIIVKAREFDAKVPPVEPHSGSNATDDGEGEILEDFADDPTAEELKSAIDQLSERPSCVGVFRSLEGRKAVDSFPGLLLG